MTQEIIRNSRTGATWPLVHEALLEKLSEYDGKATTFLGEAEAMFSGPDDYLDALVELVGEPNGNLANGASWLIKSAIEKGMVLSEEQTEALIAQLPAMTDWAAQLHICQFMRRLDVKAKRAHDVASWLTGFLGHNRPLLRAWSLDAFGALAETHREFADAFNAALSRAQHDEAASVRARARHIAPI
ncbi:hypothetical protein [uncultured Erythrobacter sp.]|uniref:hypothetical protein n=1 Tax=uncultured Erythrobacter sp. TaxID=263913 RepID=UPI0026068CEE|nr:hypothetical protein [uncultured Erythrobacter sp.]